MREIASWSLPLGRYFGITVRAHWLFWIFSLAAVLRAASPKGNVEPYVAQALIVQGVLLISVILHEFGHCFGARYVDGEASEVLLWPLGGLAFVDVPNTPRAHFITVICGPAVNVLLCLFAVVGLAMFGLSPSKLLNPFYDVYFLREGLYSFADEKLVTDLAWAPALLARLFTLNWILFLFNMLLPAFPMDCGRLVQCVLWSHLGFHQATKIVLRVSFIAALVLGICAILFIGEDNPIAMITLFSIAVFIYMICKQQEFLMETGALGEEGIFGYDFSQGYTSLERDNPQPRRPKKKNFIQRWLQDRAEKKRRQEEQQRQEEERRVDELLAKVLQGGGMHALTDEEKRFLVRVSAKMRNRDQS
jgi:hypothetical protein